MKVRSAVAVILALTAVAACQEKLAMPTDCPELCPGSSLNIRDTVLTARVGLDSTYVGYLRADNVAALLVSNGIAAGEARAFAGFARRSDTVFVDGVAQLYTIDSVGFTINIIARDTAAHGLRLIVHRIPPVLVDTTTSFAGIDSSLTPESLVDSVSVPDTLKSGSVKLILKGNALALIAPSEADTGKLAIGIRVNADIPTGIRLGAASGTLGPPVMTTWVHVAVTDTAKQRQTIVAGATLANYVIAPPPLPAPDQLFLGGKSGSRVLLRFTLPAALKDSAAIIRATLELTPSAPLIGLNNDPGDLQIRGVLVDIGAKSPSLSGLSAFGKLPTGGTGVQSIDIRSVVAAWLGPSGTTPSLLLGLAPEGGTFSRPEFFSTLAASGAPRLRLTYALPSQPGHP